MSVCEELLPCHRSVRVPLADAMPLAALSIPIAVAERAIEAVRHSAACFYPEPRIHFSDIEIF